VKREAKKNRILQFALLLLLLLLLLSYHRQELLMKLPYLAEIYD
jgi:hypothetical protein